jgi:membrane-associated phospholipid phosphatase
MPSIHSTLAWAAITPYAKAYDAPWLYGVAALTNVARIGGRDHWFSDTVGSALIGYGLGSLFWESRSHDKSSPSLYVLPSEIGLEWKTP